MTKSDPYHNEYECPNDDCGEWISVPIPLAKYVTCPGCQTKLEIHPDAEFDEDGWHDRTHLSVVEERPSVSTDDLYREHMKRMLAHAKRVEDDK